MSKFYVMIPNKDKHKAKMQLSQRITKPHPNFYYDVGNPELLGAYRLQTKHKKKKNSK